MDLILIIVVRLVAAGLWVALVFMGFFYFVNKRLDDYRTRILKILLFLPPAALSAGGLYLQLWHFPKLRIIIYIITALSALYFFIMEDRSFIIKLTKITLLTASVLGVVFFLSVLSILEEMSNAREHYFGILNYSGHEIIIKEVRFNKKRVEFDREYRGRPQRCLTIKKDDNFYFKRWAAKPEILSVLIYDSETKTEKLWKIKLLKPSQRVDCNYDMIYSSQGFPKNVPCRFSPG